MADSKLSQRKGSAGGGLLAHYAAMPSDNPDKNTSSEKQTGEMPNDRGRPSPNAGPREIGGRNGPEPTRFGDWEKAGRCIDF